MNSLALCFEGGSLSDADLVAELLTMFELEALGNVEAVDEDVSGYTAVVTSRFQHRKPYKRFQKYCWSTALT